MIKKIIGIGILGYYKNNGKTGICGFRYTKYHVKNTTNTEYIL